MTEGAYSLMLLSGQRVIIKGKCEEVIVTGSRVVSATSIGKPGHKLANAVPYRRVSQES